MELLNFKVIGIGHFAANCIKEIDRQNLTAVKTMEWRHFSECDLHEVGEFLNEETKITIIIADLGIQLLNSMALSAVNLSKEAGAITLCILTTPFIFEGEKAFRMALTTASNIQSISDACLILGEDVPEDTEFSISQMDNRIGNNIYASTIADMVRDLVVLLSHSGSINIDNDDLELSLRDKATFAIARGKGCGENRVSEALEEALSSPLMSKCEIHTSRNILIKLLVSDQIELRTKEISSLSGFLDRMPSYVDMKCCIAKSDNLQGEVELILLASGFDVKLNQ